MAKKIEMETVKIIFKSGTSTCVVMCKEDAKDLFKKFDNEQRSHSIIDLSVRLENIDCLEVLKKL